MSSKVDQPPSPRTTFFAIAVLSACLLSLLALGLVFKQEPAGWTLSDSPTAQPKGENPADDFVNPVN